MMSRRPYRDSDNYSKNEYCDGNSHNGDDDDNDDACDETKEFLPSSSGSDRDREKSKQAELPSRRSSCSRSCRRCSFCGRIVLLLSGTMVIVVFFLRRTHPEIGNFGNGVLDKFLSSSSSAFLDLPYEGYAWRLLQVGGEQEESSSSLVSPLLRVGKDNVHDYGHAVSMSGDGNLLAVGLPGDRPGGGRVDLFEWMDAAEEEGGAHPHQPGGWKLKGTWSPAAGSYRHRGKEHQAVALSSSATTTNAAANKDRDNDGEGGEGGEGEGGGEGEDFVRVAFTSADVVSVQHVSPNRRSQITSEYGTSGHFGRSLAFNGDGSVLAVAAEHQRRGFVRVVTTKTTKEAATSSGEQHQDNNDNDKPTNVDSESDDNNNTTTATTKVDDNNGTTLIDETNNNNNDTDANKSETTSGGSSGSGAGDKPNNDDTGAADADADADGGDDSSSSDASTRHRQRQRRRRQANVPFSDLTWEPMGRDIDNTRLGTPVALDTAGRRLVVVTTSNVVRTLDWNETQQQWQNAGASEETPVIRTTTFPQGTFALSADGQVLAVSNTVMMGANNKELVHQVQVYQWAYNETLQAMTWRIKGQALTEDSNNSNSDDDGTSSHFGAALQLSANGQVLAVGAPSVTAAGNAQRQLQDEQQQQNATDDDPEPQSVEPAAVGHVSVFQYRRARRKNEVDEWIEVGGCIWEEKQQRQPEGAAAAAAAGATATTGTSSSLFGSSLAMSASGTRLAIGAPHRAVGNTTNAGSVFVYEWSKEEEDLA